MRQNVSRPKCRTKYRECNMVVNGTHPVLTACEYARTNMAWRILLISHTRTNTGVSRKSILLSSTKQILHFYDTYLITYYWRGGVQNTNVKNTNVHNTNGSKYQWGGNVSDVACSKLAQHQKLGILSFLGLRGHLFVILSLTISEVLVNPRKFFTGVRKVTNGRFQK